MPPSMMVIGRLSRVCASALMKSLPRPRSVPSDSHTRSTSCTAARNWAIAGSASERSTVCGFGFICCRRTRAEPAGSSEMSRVPSDNGMSATARRSSSARAMMSLAVRTRRSQVAAAAQPSSIMIAIGPREVDAASGGCHSGPAAAMITSAASASRIRVSHHGVRAGVSSLGAISSKSRVGGKSMRRGRGGIKRSSHHSTGSVNRPISTSGWAKPMGNPAIMPSPSPEPPAAAGFRYQPQRRRCGRAAPVEARSPAGRCDGW